MKKGDVEMAKHFSKKYRNKGWVFDYPVSAIWNKYLFCQDACQCLMLHPYITASKTIAEVNFWRPWKTVNSCDLLIIREYGSTLYVGLARAISPTNTNFRLTFLLTRLQEALYEDLAV